MTLDPPASQCVPWLIAYPALTRVRGEQRWHSYGCKRQHNMAPITHCMQAGADPEIGCEGRDWNELSTNLLPPFSHISSICIFFLAHSFVLFVDPGLSSTENGAPLFLLQVTGCLQDIVSFPCHDRWSPASSQSRHLQQPASSQHQTARHCMLQRCKVKVQSTIGRRPRCAPNRELLK